jgi:chaperonin GroEL (HSP60 family)
MQNIFRGATDNYMDDIERCIDDGVNTYKGLARDGRLLAGAGAAEAELAYQVNKTTCLHLISLNLESVEISILHLYNSCQIELCLDSNSIRTTTCFFVAI